MYRENSGFSSTCLIASLLLSTLQSLLPFCICAYFSCCVGGWSSLPRTQHPPTPARPTSILPCLKHLQIQAVTATAAARAALLAVNGPQGAAAGNPRCGAACSAIRVAPSDHTTPHNRHWKRLMRQSRTVLAGTCLIRLTHCSAVMKKSIQSVQKVVTRWEHHIRQQCYPAS